MNQFVIDIAVKNSQRWLNANACDGSFKIWPDSSSLRYVDVSITEWNGNSFILDLIVYIDLIVNL